MTSLLHRFLVRPAGLMAVLLGLAAAPAAHAQINININSPTWGPPAPAGAQYYYLSGVEGYYDLRAGQYVFLDNGRWARARALPARYRGVTLQPVVVDYVGATPWVLLPTYRTKYPKPGRGNSNSPMGMPPGQAKKLYGGKPGHGNGQGNSQGKDKDKGKGHGKHK